MGKIILSFQEWLNEFNMSTLGKEIVNIAPVANMGVDHRSKKNMIAAAVSLVRQYDLSADHGWIKHHLGYESGKPFGYLLNIDTIAPLGGGAYGMFVSNEVERVLPPEITRPYEFSADKENKSQSQKLSNFLKTQAIKDIKKQFPNLNTSTLQDAATIHLNVAKTKSFVETEIAQGKVKPEDFEEEFIIRLGSTIVHESVHALERKYLGTTNEINTEKAEAHFTQWAYQNPNKVKQSFK
jgi:hypothetical protein